MFYIIEIEKEKSFELINSDKISEINNEFKILKVIYTINFDEAVKIYDNYLNNIR